MDKIFMAALAVLFATGLAASAQEPDAPEYDVVAVLIPVREAVISSQTDGNVDKINFQKGERFKKGDVILEIDGRRINIEHKRMVEQYEFAKRTYDDQKALFDKNFTSEYELKKREYELDMALLALEESKINVSHCRIIAPFDGRMEDIATREHEMARSGQPLFRIIDDGEVFAVVNIPASEHAKYPPGTKIRIDLSDNLPAERRGKSPWVVEGTVAIVSSQIDPRSGTIEIRALIDNHDHKIISGLTGKLRK